MLTQAADWPANIGPLYLCTHTLALPTRPTRHVVHTPSAWGSQLTSPLPRVQGASGSVSEPAQPSNQTRSPKSRPSTLDPGMQPITTWYQASRRGLTREPRSLESIRAPKLEEASVNWKTRR
ncbi:hypothetical protein BCR34DRAFT_96110 [Clohesyomyces aquaticus]|uniref:Uncharacterized protein n=1 Tax=Clohesyomyces aquaticus TaxID=1231657 RepID=A0A1Y2A283_9PLEO|nr:hypothetical protein BCR34DRAFT_96110 [Clohesyomyces aquaticus]